MPTTARPLNDWTRIPSMPPGLRLEVELGLAGKGLVTALRDIFSADAVGDLPQIPAGRRSTVGKLVDPDMPCVVKRYEAPGLFLLRTLGVRSKAEREARALDQLVRHVGNPVRPVAWCALRRFGMVPYCYVVTTELTGSHDLRRLRNTSDPEERQRLEDLVVERLPGMLADCHRADFFMANVVLKNVLFQPETGTLAFIDLVHGRHIPDLPRSLRIRDLATIYRNLRHTLSEEQRDRFLRAYVASLGRDAEADVPGMRAEIEARALRLAHEAGWRRWTHRLRGWFKYTWIGSRLTGHTHGMRT